MIYILLGVVFVLLVAFGIFLFLRGMEMIFGEEEEGEESSFDN